jgi:DNA-binding MarR family transcriptional regulator
MAEADPIRVPEDFDREFPGASKSAAEAAANLVRTADALLREFDRRRREVADLSASGFQALAILDGAGEPIPGHVVAERLLVSSASMTSLFDTLERRRLIERQPHPVDRRKVLIRLTDEGAAIVDQMLPIVHAASTEAFADLSERDRERLIDRLSVVRGRLAEVATSRPASPKRRRHPRR